MLGIDEGAGAARLLRLGDDLEGERVFPELSGP